MDYKCIIFDCDGVLVDSEAITCKVLSQMAGELGIPLSVEEAEEQFTGTSFNEVLSYLESHLPQGLPATFEPDYRKRTFEAFTTELQPVPGILRLIEKLDVPYCVASSGPLNKIRHNLEITGLADKLEGRMYSCYDIGNWKPEPDIFLYAASEMGYSPHDCIVIEDTSIGVAAALAGGFRVFRYSRTGAPAQHGVTVFRDMEELGGWLGV